MQILALTSIDQTLVGYGEAFGILFALLAFAYAFTVAEARWHDRRHHR